MKDIGKRERIVWMILVAAVFGAVAYSSINLFTGDGSLSWHSRQKEFWAMAGETAVVFGLLVMALRRNLNAGSRRVEVGVIVAVFLWVHQVLVPVLVSGLYMGYLVCMGGWLQFRLAGVKGRNGGRWQPEGLARQFLLGSVFVVSCFCVMSALGIGRILYLWMFVLVTAVLMIADRGFRRVCRQNAGWIRALKWGDSAPYGKRITEEEIPERQIPERQIPEKQITEKQSGSKTWTEVWMAAALLTLFFIQAGRMNIAVDFDSLWYGVRSPYILDNGRGIYENMGMIGIVYTYSKGFEVLTLPLSILPSYSFVISLNLWLAAGVLAVCFRIGKRCMERRSAELLTVFVASIPGIMNMVTTAKSDVATLYVQLIMVEELLRCLEGQPEALWYGLAAFFFTWTLKPTALVFSTAILGMSGIWFLAKRKKVQWGGRAALATLALSFTALAGIWARTFLITGLPVTSVFSSLLTKLGFQMKYPFQVQNIPNSGSEAAMGQWIKDTVKRVWGILLNPQGADMDHVILAWGSLGVWFLLWVWLIWCFLDKRERTREERQLDGCLHTVCLPFFACCAVSLVLLTQVDGNYFMLFYVLLSVYVFRLCERLSGTQIRKRIQALAVPVMVFSAVIMMVTNWSWALGFTPAAWLHKGYVSHQEQQHRELAEAGNGQIWEILAGNPRNRLIAIGEHPKVLTFPCSAQSYLDITGTWGNVVLVKYMDNFVEFMEYARTDYVYAQAGYISEEDRAWSLTCDLIEYGILIPVCYEQGNMLAEVHTEGERTEHSVELLEEFKGNYRRAGE